MKDKFAYSEFEGLVTRRHERASSFVNEKLNDLIHYSEVPTTIY